VHLDPKRARFRLDDKGELRLVSGLRPARCECRGTDRVGDELRNDQNRGIDQLLAGREAGVRQRRGRPAPGMANRHRHGRQLKAVAGRIG